MTQRLTKEEFSRRLKELMLAKGLDAATAARRADLPRNNVQTYMAGRSFPTELSLAKLAKALGVSPEELLPGDGPRDPLGDHQEGGPFAMLTDVQLAALSAGECPICLKRGFVIGPQGGAAINIECAQIDCRNRFNVVFMSGRAMMGQDLFDGRAGPPWPSEPPKREDA